MLSNISNYTPEVIEFVLSDQVKELFPLKLFEGAKDYEEIEDLITDNFLCLNPEHESATRLMDDYEIYEIREEYCIKQEQEIPIKTVELEEAIENAKRIKREAEEALLAVSAQIKELAAKVKAGTMEYALSPTKTIRIALNGYYLFYSWVQGEMKLVKAEPIPEWDKGSLWSQEVKNRVAMKELFGLEYPEVNKPSNAVDNEDF